MKRFDLGGKVALITGAARGIGLAAAQAIVRRGASVALVDVDEGAVVEAAGRLGRDHAIGLRADVTDAVAVQRAVDATAERFGGIDVLIANAGIAPRAAPVRTLPAQEWERVVEVNLLGVYRTVRAGLEQIIERRGHVVLTSSVYAFVNGALMSPYAAAKAGVEQLGLALRLELAPHGAGVTVAYFGFVDTPMVRQELERWHQLSGDDGAAILRRAIPPAQAAEAIAGAIERRQSRVIAPRGWAVLLSLRGVANPAFEAVAARSGRLRRAVHEGEGGAEGRS